MQKLALQVRFVKNAATSFGLDTFTSRTQTFEGNLALADEDFEDFNDEDANNDVEIEELTYFSLSHKLSLLLMVPMRITLLVPSTSRWRRWVRCPNSLWHAQPYLPS